MPILPSARRISRLARRRDRSRNDAERSLVRAFATFAHAAASLEKSPGQLLTGLARVSGELKHAGSRRKNSLRDNNRALGFLTHIPEDLPHVGVLAPAGISREVTVQSPGRIR
jgi:hypothetical protein